MRIGTHRLTNRTCRGQPKGRDGLQSPDAGGGRSLPSLGRCPPAPDSHRRMHRARGSRGRRERRATFLHPVARLPRLGAQRLGAVSFPAISASPSSFRARRLLRIAFAELIWGATRAGSAPFAMYACSFAT